MKTISALFVVTLLAACAGTPVDTPVQTIVDGSGNAVQSAGGIVTGGNDTTNGALGGPSDVAE